MKAKKVLTIQIKMSKEELLLVQKALRYCAEHGTPSAEAERDLLVMSSQLQKLYEEL